MKPLSIPGAALLAATFVASTHAQAATECQAEIVKGRAGHWSYRLIDGRKCWYEGKNQIPKTELFWPDKEEAAAPASATAHNPRPASPPETNAQASPRAVEESTDPEDGSCCWPTKNEAAKEESARQEPSFEARWRSLGLRPMN